ncbi:unnamed protein product, partial [Prorocentrum cordatum]
AEVFASDEAWAAGRAEPQTLLYCATCWGHTTDINGRGLIAPCPSRKLASAAANKSAISSVCRHPKKARGLLGELPSPLASERYWSRYFFEGSEDGLAMLENPPAVIDSTGPGRPQLHMVLASFRLDEIRAGELGQRAVERIAEKTRAEEPWEED